MAIVILCPACRTRLTLGDDRAGETFECPKCDAKISIPVLVPTPPPPHRPVPPPIPYTPSPPLPPPVADSEPLPMSLDDEEDSSPRRRRARKRTIRRWFILCGIAAGLLIVVLAVVGRSMYFSETRQVERVMKKEIETKLGLPVERVDLVPYGKGYSGVAILKGGGKLHIRVEVYDNGKMSYSVN